VDYGWTQLIQDDYEVRWLPPEAFSPGRRTQQSDVYSFAMTALESMTHDHPWAQFKRHNDLIPALFNGVRPDRPTEKVVIARGLDDALWTLITECWYTEPILRPTIKVVAARLKQMIST